MGVLRNLRLLSRLSSLTTALGLALSVGGCGDSGAQSPPPAEKGDASQPLSATLQLNWVADPQFGGFYAARDLGFFESAGLNITVTQGSASIPAPQLVASGKVDFAVVSAPQVLEIALAGGDLIALYAVFQQSPRAIMVHEKAPWKTIEELWTSDATIALEEGLSEYAWLDKMYDGKRLKRVPYSGSYAQFVADPKMANQCYVTSEPVMLHLQHVPVRVLLTNAAGFNPYDTVVVTRRKFLDSNRDACARFVKACAQGWRAYLDDPTEINASLHALNPAMSLEAFLGGANAQRALIETAQTKELGLGAMTDARWQALADQLFDMKRIPSKPVAASLYHW